MSLPVKSVFGRYELLGCIGRGGMAEIYLARQVGILGFEKLLVVKTILPNLTDSTGAQEFIDMFLDEARLAAYLNHPNIVQIYDFGEVDGRYFLAMEYVRGVDAGCLLNRIKEMGQYLPIEHAVKIVSAVCEALLCAHGLCDPQGRPLNLVHRDVSPPNVLISLDGSVKLTDFGVAKAKDRITKTQIGTLKGKLLYMSPEQIQAKELDHRSDIFAAGILLYELCTGLRPFDGSSLYVVREQILDRPPLHPSAWRPDFPPELVPIVERALAKDPAERYQTALEMQMALETFLVDKRLISNSARLGKFIRDFFEEQVQADVTQIFSAVIDIDSPADSIEVFARREVPSKETPSANDWLARTIDLHSSSPGPHRTQEDSEELLPTEKLSLSQIELRFEEAPTISDQPINAEEPPTPIAPEAAGAQPIPTVPSQAGPFGHHVTQPSLEPTEDSPVDQDIDSDLETLTTAMRPLSTLRQENVGGPEQDPFALDIDIDGPSSILAEAARTRDSIAELNRGASFLLNRDFPAAKAAFARAADLDPGLAQAFRGLGIALAKLGDWSEATAAYGRFLDLDPYGEGAEKARSIIKKLCRRS